MKVTINKPEDSIDLSQVTEDMYFVGVFKGKPQNLLTRERPDQGNYCFRYLKEKFTNGRGAAFDGSISGCIEHYINECSGEVHAFRTYQEAFKFIAENL